MPSAGVWVVTQRHAASSSITSRSPASGRGTIHTFTILHKAYRAEYADRVPYNVIVVELEEGPLFHSNLIGCENAAIRVGMPVEVVFDRIDDELTLPRFRPSE